MIRQPPRSTPFPNTTLSRSYFACSGEDCTARCIAAGSTGAMSDRGARSNVQATGVGVPRSDSTRSEEHTSELQSRQYLVCRLLLEKKTSTHKCSRAHHPPHE